VPEGGAEEPPQPPGKVAKLKRLPMFVHTTLERNAVTCIYNAFGREEHNRKARVAESHSSWAAIGLADRAGA